MKNLFFLFLNIILLFNLSSCSKDIEVFSKIDVNKLSLINESKLTFENIKFHYKYNDSIFENINHRKSLSPGKSINFTNSYSNEFYFTLENQGEVFESNLFFVDFDNEKNRTVKISIANNINQEITFLIE